MKKILLLIWLLIPYKVLSLELSDSGKIIANKTINMIDENNSVLVNLSVKGNSYNYYDSTNVVLVIDASSDNTNIINDIKSNANKLIDLLLETNNVNVGIVTFTDNILISNTTNGLLNNKKELKSFVNSIEASKNIGSNIDKALNTAYSLFDKTVGNNNIILISNVQTSLFTIINNDNNEIITRNNLNSRMFLCYLNGKFYSNNNYNSKEKCEQYEGVWKDFSSFEANNLTSDKIKNDDIKVYSIDYMSVENQLLESISTEEKYYKISNKKELTDSINSIYKNMFVVAENIIIKDIIPAYLEIDTNYLKEYNNVIINTNINNEKEIIWSIGDINAYKDYILEYKLSSNDNNSFLINTNAVLEGNATIDNTYYEDSNGKIELKFDMLDVNKVLVVNNDNSIIDDVYKNNNVVNNNEELLTREESTINNKEIISIALSLVILIIIVYKKNH